jgi:hypothetical protein
MDKFYNWKNEYSLKTRQSARDERRVIPEHTVANKI